MVLNAIFTVGALQQIQLLIIQDIFTALVFNGPILKWYTCFNFLFVQGVRENCV